MSELGDLDVIVVGAGFAGLYLVHRLRQARFSVLALEAGDGVGGTWYWNRYPGARCDVPSLEYSFGFDEDLQQEWEWTERYAGQPEILRYLEHVADRLDLRRSIRLGTRVTAAAFDEAAVRWTVTTDRGDGLTSRFLVMATGCLSSANVPDIPGLASFSGRTFHTGAWPHDGVDLTGERVGVIGTGSSGVQAIPLIAADADHLTVFQRTAAYSIPAHNHPLDPAVQAAVKADYPGLRARNRQMATGFGSMSPRPRPSALLDDEDQRRAEYDRRWAAGGLLFMGAYQDLASDEAANETAAEYVREKIRSIVHDPATAERLCPTQVIGCKRVCSDTGYYETFNRPNVRLVDLTETPIEEITESGVRTSAEHIDLDALVLATGFDAMTGSLLRIDIRGTGGMTLYTAWHAGPKTLLGLGVPGFPNLFLVTGPGSPSVLSNMVGAVEQHGDWITQCLVDLRERGVQQIEPTDAAADEWVARVNAVADRTLYPTCNSWYLGANIPGKPRIFMPMLGFGTYSTHCAEVAAAGYPGFTLR
jgi:cation diffusion facilitator CzcD-associated flavoprotein CzcO